MPETRLHNKLINTPAVTDLVSTRIDPAMRKQTDALPAISFLRVSTNAVNHSTGTTTIFQCRVQVDCWGATYASAKAVASAVREALGGWSDTSGTPDITMSHQVAEQDTTEPTEPGRDTIIHRVSQDYLLDVSTV